MWYYSWLQSGAIGYDIFVLYVLIVEIFKWVVHRRIEKAIKRTYHEGNLIHGPDDV